MNYKQEALPNPGRGLKGHESESNLKCNISPDSGKYNPKISFRIKKLGINLGELADALRIPFAKLQDFLDGFPDAELGESVLSLLLRVLDRAEKDPEWTFAKDPEARHSFWFWLRRQRIKVPDAARCLGMSDDELHHLLAHPSLITPEIEKRLVWFRVHAEPNHSGKSWDFIVKKMASGNRGGERLHFQNLPFEHETELFLEIPWTPAKTKLRVLRGDGRECSFEHLPICALCKHWCADSPGTGYCRRPGRKREGYTMARNTCWKFVRCEKARSVNKGPQPRRHNIEELRSLIRAGGWACSR